MHFQTFLLHPFEKQFVLLSIPTLTFIHFSTGSGHPISPISSWHVMRAFRVGLDLQNGNNLWQEFEKYSLLFIRAVL